MSFFNSLSEYVSNSVAGLSLSPKRYASLAVEAHRGRNCFSFRFSLSRTDTSESSAGVSPGSRSNSGDSNTPGFPKVVPAPGASALVQRRRSTLEALVPNPPVRRPGSFRVRSPKTPQERPSNFCCRRQSWPEIDHQVRSG